MEAPNKKNKTTLVVGAIGFLGALAGILTYMNIMIFNDSGWKISDFSGRWGTGLYAAPLTVVSSDDFFAFDIDSEGKVLGKLNYGKIVVTGKISNPKLIKIGGQQIQQVDVELFFDGKEAVRGAAIIHVGDRIKLTIPAPLPNMDEFFIGATVERM